MVQALKSKAELQERFDQLATQKRLVRILQPCVCVCMYVCVFGLVKSVDVLLIV